MTTILHSVSSERAALSVRDAAALLGISQRHLWTLAATGRAPKPVSLGRSKRWSRAELEAWLIAESAKANGKGAA